MMQRVLVGIALVLAAAYAPATVLAQEAADTSATYFTRGPEFLARYDLVPWLDLRGRYDQVTDRPNAPDFDRQRATLRAGVSWERAARPFSAEVGVRASIGSDHNRETWSPFDNEVADTVEFDRIGVRLASTGGEALMAGKMRSPIPLSDMLWDDDLRPVGLAYTSRLGWTRLQGFSLGIGWFNRARFDSDDGRVSLVQLGFEGGNPATRGSEVRVAHAAFGSTQELVQQGLPRQNRVVVVPNGSGTVVYDERFKVVDLQIAGHVHAGGWPIKARVDGAINSAAATSERKAIRTRLSAGGATAPWGIEAAWMYQRIEREAVLGAFNSDDWWFHSRLNGHGISLEVGVGRPLLARLLAFHEKRDDVTDPTRRLIGELRWRWGE